MSETLMNHHKEREARGETEYEERKRIREEQKLQLKKYLSQKN